MISPATLLATFLALWGFPPPTSAAAPAAPEPRPNILVIMTDDQTVADMRVLPKTRALLAAKGTTFANSFVDFSLCCPSRSTFLTGQYAHNHGVLANGGPQGGYAHLDNSNTLPLWLQDAGYYHRPSGQVSQQLRRGLSRAAAGMVALVRADRPLHLPDVRLHGEPGRRAGGLRRVSRGLPDGRARGRGRDDPALAGGRQPAVLRHRGADRPPPRADRPRPDASPARAPLRGAVRRGAAADEALLQRARRLGQAGSHPPPPAAQPGQAGLRDGDLPGAPRLAARRGRSRGAPGQGPRGDRPARPHGDLLHLGQRLPPRRAPRPRGEVPAVRGVDPGAAHRLRRPRRRRLPGGRHGPAAGVQRRSRADDRVSHRSPRPPGDGWPVAPPWLSIPGWRRAGPC